MSATSNPVFRLVFRVSLVLAFIAMAQYAKVLVQIKDAQMNFKSLSPGISTEGEKKTKERIAGSLKIAGFEVEGKDILVKITKTGSATFDLVTVLQAKILIFSFQREVVFHAEPAYDAAL
jgi:hypothetical protein